MDEDEWEDRLDQCILGLTREGLSDGAKIYRRLRKLFLRGGGIWIKHFSAGSEKVADLREHTKMLANVHNFVPDAVFIDSADALVPEGAITSSKDYEHGEEVYKAIKAWIKEDQLVCWTVTQSNKQGMSAPIADQQHAFGSSGKVNNAELVISINRTPDESKMGRTNLFVVKDRHGPGQFYINIRTDFERMLFWRNSDNE